RFLGDEVIEGGSPIEDAVYYGVEFARAGLDYLSISKGGKFEDAKQPKTGQAVYPYTGRSGYECMPTVLSDARGPFGRRIALDAPGVALSNDGRRRLLPPRWSGLSEEEGNSQDRQDAEAG